MRFTCLLCLLLALCGPYPSNSQSSKGGPSLEGVRFRESELINRTWKDAAGKEIKFLDRKDVTHGKLTTLTIFKYGYGDTSGIRCVDFYLKPKMVGGLEQQYVLLYHDYDERLVNGLDVTEKDGQIGIDISRSGSLAGSGSSYYYIYGTNGFYRGISAFIDVPKPK